LTISDIAGISTRVADKEMQKSKVKFAYGNKEKAMELIYKIKNNLYNPIYIDKFFSKSGGLVN
jgi:hypothetical protein